MIKISPCQITATDTKISPSKIPYFPLPVNAIWKALFDHRKIKIIISPPPHCLWPPNLVGWWLILWAPIHIVTQSLITRPCYITWLTKNLYLYYSNNFGPKLDKSVKYNEQFPLIKLHDPWITWFCEVDRFINSE